MQLFRQWPIFLIGRILPAAIAFGGIGLYTRMVDPASFGTYALLLSTSFFVGLAGFAWLRVATIRMMATIAADDVADYTASIVAAFLSTALVVATVVVVLVHVSSPKLPIGLAFLTAGTAIASNWFELNVSVAQARLRFITYGLLQGGRAVATLGASVLLILCHLKTQALLGGFIVGNLSALGMLAAWAPALRGRCRREIVRRLWHFGWPSSASSLSCGIPTLQRYLLGMFAGSAALGIFAVSNDFPMQTLGLLMGTVTIAGQPLTFLARDRGSEEQLRGQLRNNARLLFAVGLAATTGLIVLASPIAHVFFGVKFREGAAALIILSALTTLCTSLRTYYFEQAFEIALATRPIAILTALRMGIGLLASFLLIARFGALGAGAANLISDSIALAVSAFWARRFIVMPIPFRSLGSIAVATLAMVVVIECIPHRTSALGFAIAAACGMLTFCVTCAAIYARQIRTSLLPRLQFSQSGTHS